MQTPCVSLLTSVLSVLEASWLTIIPDYRLSKEADAAYYQQKREAEGLLEKAKGYGALVDVLGGPQTFLQFQMMESRTYERLAEANAHAINGLQPKITSWNTGKHTASFTLILERRIQLTI